MKNEEEAEESTTDICLESPKDDDAFIYYWSILVEYVAERDNFRESHLTQLSIMCDHLVNYDKCSEYIDENGFTYESSGRSGFIIKTFPHVDLMHRYSTAIKDYSKLLDITLAKDKTMKEEKNEDWD